MRCPNDNTDLITIERQGVDILTCPACQGAWLERGELDEIINRSRPQRQDASGEARRSGGFMDRFDDMFEDRGRDHHKSRRRHDKYDDDDDDYRDDDYRGKRKKKSKRSMLEDLLDF